MFLDGVFFLFISCHFTNSAWSENCWFFFVAADLLFLCFSSLLGLLPLLVLLLRFGIFKSALLTISLCRSDDYRLCMSFAVCAFF